MSLSEPYNVKEYTHTNESCLRSPYLSMPSSAPSFLVLFLQLTCIIIPTLSSRLPHAHRHSTTMTPKSVEEKAISVPLTKYMTSRNLKDIVTSDRRRINSIYGSLSPQYDSSFTSPISANNADTDLDNTIAIQTYAVSYIANVTVGDSIRKVFFALQSSINNRTVYFR